MLWIVYLSYRQQSKNTHLLTFCNFDELQTDDISWKSFPIKIEKCFPTIKKESRKLQFSVFLIYTYIFVCKPVPQVRGKISK